MFIITAVAQEVLDCIDLGKANQAGSGMNFIKGFNLLMLKKILKVIRQCESLVSDNRTAELPPSIALDEISTKEELVFLELDNSLANLWAFVEHYYDAKCHNFDRVTDSISIEEGSSLIKEIQLALKDGGLPTDDRVLSFRKYID